MKRLSISHYLCPSGYPIERFFDAAASAGAGAVGLTVRALEENGVIQRYAALRSHPVRHGMRRQISIAGLSTRRRP